MCQKLLHAVTGRMTQILEDPAFMKQYCVISKYTYIYIYIYIYNSYICID